MVLKNSFGFILTHLPLICLAGVFSFMALALTFTTLKSRGIGRSFCRQSILQQQKISQNTIQSIFNLNPRARFLNARLKLLETQLTLAIATKNGPAIIKTKLEINQTKTQQKGIAALQNSIIQSGLIAISNEQKNFLNKIGNVGTANIENLKSTAPRIAIEPESKSDLAPVYVLKQQFELKQEMSASWNEVFKWKKQLNQSHSYQNGCSGTLKQKNANQLEPKLTGDRFF